MRHESTDIYLERGVGFIVRVSQELCVVGLSLVVLNAGTCFGGPGLLVTGVAY